MNNSREFTETVSAAYLRGDIRLFENRLWIVAGVRYERTDTKGSGPLNDINAQYQRDADGSFVRNAAGQRVDLTGDALAAPATPFSGARGEFETRLRWLLSEPQCDVNLTENPVVRAA